jgi:lincosamide nucleotidyltransferase A/C/D/E
VEAADVLEVIDLLAGVGVRFWIDGGWGVDALVGEQTRSHLDLDLAIRTEDLSMYIRAMVSAGFRTTRIDNPYNFVMGDSRGRLVDVHLVDFTVVCTTAEGRAVYGGTGLAYDVGAFGGRGWILNCEVGCCTAGFQMRSHTGYELDARDFHDVMVLHHRFGIPIPMEYDRFRDHDAIR